MKTINLTRIFAIALLLGFISTFSSYAASPAAVSAKNIRQKFSETFQNLEDRDNIPASGTVTVLFTVSDEGTIDIKKLEATSDEAANFVKENISKVPCQDNVYPYHQFYRVKIRFDRN